MLCVNENHAIVAWFKRGNADEEKYIAKQKNLCYTIKYQLQKSRGEVKMGDAIPLSCRFKGLMGCRGPKGEIGIPLGPLHKE